MRRPSVPIRDAAPARGVFVSWFTITGRRLNRTELDGAEGNQLQSIAAYLLLKVFSRAGRPAFLITITNGETGIRQILPKN